MATGPGAYEEPVDCQFSLATDWLETIGDTGPGSVHLSNDAQEATLVGIIDWKKQRDAALWFLGYSYCDDVAPYRLHRENPQAHPVFPWLYANDISFQPLSPKANTDLDPVHPKVESPFYSGEYVAYYEKAIATVRFRSFRCRFLDDTVIASNADEWKRNVFVDLEPRIQALSADGISQMHYDETGAGGPSLGPPATSFGAPIAVLQSMTGFVINWLNVPWEYLSTSQNYFYPTKIMNCVGKLNDSLFLGDFNTGTCLMQPPRFSVKSAPVAAADPAYPLRYVDLQIPFDYFEPENGAAGSPYFGHTLLPWRGNLKYYHAVREDGVSEVLPSTDFNVIFESVNE